MEGPEDSDGQEPEGHYHDALDEPQGDTIDLNSTEELNEGSLKSLEQGS